MIHYDLVCAAEHAFDGWFADSASFELQCVRGLVECPVCGAVEVRRALMAPAVARTRLPGGGTPSMPAALLSRLQRLRAEVERHCDNVGPAFADQARRIHRGKADPRGIYGETTPEEARDLAEEGVPFAAIPWVAPADG